MTTLIAFAGEPRSPSRTVESELPSRFTLVDSMGTEYYLNLAFGVILYGVDSYGWPNYGFVIGNEMFLWMDGPGGDWQESLAYTGMWDLGTMTFNGFWVNYPGGYYGEVQMWVAGAGFGEAV